MEILNLKETEKTPEVRFDTEGLLFLGGRSVHEHPENFYKEIIDIIDKVKEGKSIIVTFDFEYFNTGTAKMLLKLMRRIAEVKGSKAIWKYETGDEDMVEAGEDYNSMIDMHFDIIEKPEGEIR